MAQDEKLVREIGGEAAAGSARRSEEEADETVRRVLLVADTVERENEALLKTLSDR